MSARIGWLAVLVGCSGGGTTDETGTTGDTGEAPAPIGTAGDCAVDTSAAGALAGARQVMLDAYGYGSALPPGLSSQVLPDEAAYTAFLASAGLAPGPSGVDFATELAVAVAYAPGATCGLTLDGWDAWDVGGTPHVEVRVVDGSFACETVCDMAAVLITVVAVPRGTATTATVCGQVGGGCGASF